MSVSPGSLPEGSTQSELGLLSTDGVSERLFRLGAKVSQQSRRPGVGDSQEMSLSVTLQPSTMDTPIALPELSFAGFYEKQITAERYLPGCEAVYVDPSPSLPAPMEEFLREREIRLYSHQSELLQLFRDGANAALSTSTASGKTFGFALPIFERLLAKREGTALFIYPTKALAHDQLNTLLELDSAFDARSYPASYDGDTPSKARAAIREGSRIIVSNPHGLHLYLGFHSSWRRFLSNLEAVVVDETHLYSGKFGSNVALLLRRLRRVCAHYGSAPQFLAASGTISNPKEHAQALLGLPFSLVDSDGSPQAGKWLVMWDTGRDLKTTPLTQVANLTRHLVRCKRQVIVFSDSRHGAEMISRLASDRSNRVVTYRAGYSAETRRDIEAKLKRGEIAGVSSTSALEVGIDVGTLDTVIMNGFPGSISSFWQRAGRAGRAMQDSVVILLTGADPLGRYLLSQPEVLVNRPPELANISLTSRDLLRSHLICAASESALVAGDEAYFGASGTSLFEDLLTDQIVKTEPDGSLSYLGKGSPQRQLSFIEEHHEGYKLFLEDPSGKRRTRNERLSNSQALREAHLGAVYLNEGVSYKVIKVDHQGKMIHARREHEGPWTHAQLYRSVLTSQVEQAQILPGGAIAQLSTARVLEQVVSYIEVSGSMTKKKSLSKTPANTYPTRAISIEFPQAYFYGLSSSTEEFYPAVHGAEHALGKSFPLLSICDPRDLAGLSLKNMGQPTLFIYERSTGGAGLLEGAWENLSELFAIACDLVSSCRCSKGCPFCILDWSCKDEELSKVGAVEVLAALCDSRSSGDGL